ncbi:MAG TPA: carbohydrate porin [Gammaproteobacteria bacterium]|nr:carbohydrate porin [Gammaproteobacteria bacterium]
MKQAAYVALLCMFVTFCCAGPASADGVDFGVDYTQDFLYNADGGLSRGGGAPGIINFNGAFKLDSNNVFYADALGTFGGSISDNVGDLQGVSNVAAYNTAKLYAAWYRHSFGTTGVSVRLGLQDYATLFNMLDPAQLFVNSSFGTDPTISQVAPSIFPVTALGAVARWQSASGFYALGGVYDGVPGEPGHPAGTHIALHSGDGAFSAVELGITGSDRQPYKLAIGGWYRSTDFADPIGRMRDGNNGFYAIGSMRVTRGNGAPATSFFLQLGQAQQDRNVVKSYIGAGMTLTGLVPGRPDDVLGLGVASAQVSSVFRRMTPASADAETVIELTYQTSIGKGFSLQPDVQYVIHPGASKRVDNALVVGLRVGWAWP